jgi:hypothetical protein
MKAIGEERRKRTDTSLRRQSGKFFKDVKKRPKNVVCVCLFFFGSSLFAVPSSPQHAINTASKSEDDLPVHGLPISHSFSFVFTSIRSLSEDEEQELPSYEGVG